MTALHLGGFRPLTGVGPGQRLVDAACPLIARKGTSPGVELMLVVAEILVGQTFVVLVEIVVVRIRVICCVASLI